ncbi:hypothetical protein PLICRDRAFT_41629 [Plicaturopsis crispa FD-325 SS-3]|nr:hypothetical protein PLICRDRAFT_41629 [Plicaturopsis crispa FD-325 SS-3]
MSGQYESDSDSEASSSSCTSIDDDEVNGRATPCWATCRNILHARGYALDTCRDVKEFYHRHWSDQERALEASRATSGYYRACSSHDDNALCKDAGLPDTLFRGSRIQDGMRVVIKAVRLRSRELDVVRFLSTPPIRHEPMNHCIPVLDVIEIPEDDLGIIVMEEWSAPLMADTPCCMRLFLGCLQQIIEHIAFMHQNMIAHLDLSLVNILTDGQGHYATIDYELSRRFHDALDPRIHGGRSTEMPPEFERGECCDPFKVDIWTLAVLILRVMKLQGLCLPELIRLTGPMLAEDAKTRPTAAQVLDAFNRIVSTMPNLESCNKTTP